MPRAKIGNRVSINLGRQQERVDSLALERKLSRAAAARQLIELGFSHPKAIDFEWWENFETYGDVDGPEPFDKTKEVPLRLGSYAEEMPIEPTFLGLSTFVLIRGFIRLGWEWELYYGDHDGDGLASRRDIQRYQAGELGL